MLNLRENNYLYLFVGLLVLLLFVPVALEIRPDARLLFVQMALCVALILGVWSLTASRLWYICGWLLTALSLIFTVFTQLSPNPVFTIGSNFILLLFCILSLIIALKDVLFGGGINFNKLLGSACIYLLLGIIWAELYYFVSLVSPGSFSGFSGDAQGGIQDLLYFSFITLTTLGYGDIYPIKPVARSFAVFEAITGVLYIAMLVGSLVGANLNLALTKGE